MNQKSTVVGQLDVLIEVLLNARDRQDDDSFVSAYNTAITLCQKVNDAIAVNDISLAEGCAGNLDYFFGDSLPFEDDTEREFLRFEEVFRQLKKVL